MGPVIISRPARRALFVTCIACTAGVGATGCGDDPPDVGIPATEAPSSSSPTSATPPPTVEVNTEGTVDDETLSTSEAAANNNGAEATVP